MWFQPMLLILGGYLLGSIPSGYLAGRWIKGIDLRKYGSGTVSGSMVWEHVAHWAIIPVGVMDILKATFPVWLGLKLSMSEEVSVAAGLAAVVGHNWPIYLHFSGGRGISPFLGVLLIVFPWGFPWMLLFLAVGYLLGDSAPWALAGLILLPLFNHWIGGPAIIFWLTAFMLVITIIKRLEANHRPLPQERRARRTVLLRRIFFDRDIASHKEWINRQL
jgi:glycerol-3-phosphate acyltransferase PlsY